MRLGPVGWLIYKADTLCEPTNHGCQVAYALTHYDLTNDDFMKLRDLHKLLGMLPFFKDNL